MRPNIFSIHRVSGDIESTNESLKLWVDKDTGYGIINRLKLILHFFGIILTLFTWVAWGLVAIGVWVITLYLEVLLFLPLALYWLITGKNYVGRINRAWTNKLQDLGD